MVEGSGAQARRRLAAALALLPFAPLLRAQDGQIIPPFVTTPGEVTDRMLRLAGTGPDDVVIDLGSGDGRIVIAAARDFGARGIGVDIDARLVEQSRENARRAGVAGRTEFHVQDVRRTDLSRVTVVTVYLLPFLIDQLQPKFLDELRPGARIVTHAFGMQGWPPDRRETVRVTRRGPGNESPGDTSEIFLWWVPAQVRGDWRAQDWRLRISQNFQVLDIDAEYRGRAVKVEHAALQGTAIEFSGEGFSFRGRAARDRIAGDMSRGDARVPLGFVRD